MPKGKTQTHHKIRTLYVKYRKLQSHGRLLALIWWMCWSCGHIFPIRRSPPSAEPGIRLSRAKKDWGVGTRRLAMLRGGNTHRVSVLTLATIAT